MPYHSDRLHKFVPPEILFGAGACHIPYTQPNVCYPEPNACPDELQREHNHYKGLFDNALHGIFQGTLAGGLIIVNPAFAKMCGYADPGTAVASIPNLRNGLFAPGEFTQIETLLHRHGRLLDHETAIVRADGQRVEVSLTVLLKPARDTYLIEAFLADISERKRASQRLALLNQALAAQVENRTRELTDLDSEFRRQVDRCTRIEQELVRARDAAEAASRSKDSYLAAASHDLLQPMNAARLLVSTLQERPLQAADARLVSRIQLALENAEELLTDLLDIARLDRNAIKPSWEDFNIAELFENLQAEFEPVADASGLELRVSLSGFVVKSDYRLLSRILRNFLSNALRYTDQGGVHLGCRRRGDRLLIEVHDSGSGIPEDRLQEIFLEFRQLQAHPRGERKGVGLGLAIVERIARMLGHSVQVRSRCGHGSTFSVAVPLALPAQATPRPLSASRIAGIDELRLRRPAGH